MASLIVPFNVEDSASAFFAAADSLFTFSYFFFQFVFSSPPLPLPLAVCAAAAGCSGFAAGVEAGLAASALLLILKLV